MILVCCTKVDTSVPDPDLIDPYGFGIRIRNIVFCPTVSELEGTIDHILYVDHKFYFFYERPPGPFSIIGIQ